MCLILFIYLSRRRDDYVPPDPPQYFDVVLWPHYLLNKDELFPQTDIGKYVFFGFFSVTK